MFRDLIWTIIGLWILWRLIDAFRSISSSSKRKSSEQSYNDQYQNQQQTTYQKPPQKKGELKPGAGEYVDYEEIK